MTNGRRSTWSSFCWRWLARDQYPIPLLASAGLSVGATLPALSRLEKTGFLRRAEPGTRGRTDYSVTEEGMRRLKSGWHPLLEDSIPGDIESVLRTAALALLSGADKRNIARYLRRAAASKTADSKRRKEDPNCGRNPKFPAGRKPEAYRWMLAIHASERLAPRQECCVASLPMSLRRSSPSL